MGVFAKKSIDRLDRQKDESQNSDAIPINLALGNLQQLYGKT